MSTENTSKRRSKVGRWIAFILVVLLLGSYGLYTLRLKRPLTSRGRWIATKLWEKEVVDTARDIAVQDGGRIKPFSTWAGFTMLKLHGARGMKIRGQWRSHQIGPEAFMLGLLVSA